MKLLLHLFLSLALALAALASVLPAAKGINGAVTPSLGSESANITINPGNVAGDDPSFDYHNGGALLQVWVGKAKTNVGPVIGSQLYSIIWQTIDFICPEVDGNTNCNSGNKFHCFETDSIRDGKVEKGDTCIWKLAGGWQSRATRKLLMGAAAGTLEALTNVDVGGDSNCHTLNGKKACNVGDAVRINLPMGKPFQNYIHFMITNDRSGYGERDCCANDHRQLVDKAVDGLGDELSKEFKLPFTRDTRCIIDGFKFCGE